MNELKLEIEKISPKENDIVTIKLTRVLDFGELENIEYLSESLSKRNITLLIVNEEFNLELLSKR